MFVVLACAGVLAQIPLATAAPNVTLLGPTNGAVLLTSSATFLCNATDTLNLYNMTLFRTIGGNFGVSNFTRIMELDTDNATILHCRFNDTETCEQGETGTQSGISYVSGRFRQAVLVNAADSLRYPTFANIEYGRGTIEFWISTGTNISTANRAMLFDVQGSGRNELQIYFYLGKLYADFFDDASEQAQAYQNITWQNNSWHHIAVTWNTTGLSSGTVLDMFVDGSNTTSVRSDSFGTPGVFDQYFFIGGGDDGLEQANATFDEVRISNRARTLSEINASYRRGAGDQRNTTGNWSVAGLADGTYVWNCEVFNNETQAASALANFTFHIDTATPPVVQSILFSPNSSDDLDPGVTINVTVNATDPSNVSAVIFQYRYDVEWINITLSYNTTRQLWNGSFTTIGSERTYVYRAFANDTRGNANTSVNASVNVTVDYSWTRSPANITAYGLVSSTSPVGIVIINNTGDDTLVITLADNWPIVDVYYNTTEQFSIPAKNATSINISAKFAELDSSSNMTINISAAPAAPSKTASPQSQTIDVAMNSYSGGAYLIISIVTAPGTVTQSTTGINLSATVKNIGNDTARSVWFNWTLPSGWSITTGTQNLSLGNISGQSPLNTSTLSVAVSSSATAGIVSVCVAAAGSNVSNSSCTSVQVSCSSSDDVCGTGCVYTNDNNCPAPNVDNGGGGGGATSGGGGGGGGISFSVTPRLVMDVPVLIEGVRGTTVIFDVNVSNPEQRTELLNVTLFVAGLPQSRVQIEPAIIPRLLSPAPAPFRVSLAIPSYTSYGPVNISVSASGQARIVNVSRATTLVEKAAVLTLMVQSGTESNTTTLLHAARERVDSMRAAGWYVDGVESLLAEAEASLARFDTDTAAALAAEIVSRATQADSVQQLITALSEQQRAARDIGIMVPDSAKLTTLATGAFARGDYARARERAEQALLILNLERSSARAASELAASWYVGLAGIGVAAAALVAGHALFAHRARVRHLARLRRESETIQHAIIRLQEQHYRQHTMSTNAYRQTLAVYEQRLNRIAHEQERLAHANVAAAEQQLRTVQHQYYVDKTISAPAYKRISRRLRRERRARERKPSARHVFAILIMLLLVPHVFATPQQDARVAIDQATARMVALQINNFTTHRMNETIAEAYRLLPTEPLGALALAQYAENLADRAIQVDALIDETEAQLYQAQSSGTAPEGSREAFNAGVRAFGDERYEEADTALRGVLAAIEDAESARTLSASLAGARADAIGSFLRVHWPGVLALIIACGSMAGVVFFCRAWLCDRSRGQRLQNELASARGALADLQRRYFTSRTISRSEYLESLHDLRVRIAILEKECALQSA